VRSEFLTSKKKKGGPGDAAEKVSCAQKDEKPDGEECGTPEREKTPLAASAFQKFKQRMRPKHVPGGASTESKKEQPRPTKPGGGCDVG